MKKKKAAARKAKPKARKPAVKKKAAKKTVSKTSRRLRPALIGDVPPENVFYLSDGRVLKNVVELRDALPSMNAEIYQHHVNSERNDFANWIKEAVGDPKLGSSVQKIKSQATLLKKMKQYCR